MMTNCARTQKESPGSTLEKWFADSETLIDIEIGCGTGRFLCQIAEKQRDVRFIGIEVNPELCRRAVQRAEGAGLSNVVFASTDASSLLQYVPSNMIREIHIYFPSPYPTHRRIFDQTFVNHMYRVLKLDGSARVVTDHKEYFEEISALFASRRWQHISWSPIGEKRSDGLIVGTPAEFRYGGKYVIQVLK